MSEYIPCSSFWCYPTRDAFLVSSICMKISTFLCSKRRKIQCFQKRMKVHQTLATSPIAQKLTSPWGPLYTQNSPHKEKLVITIGKKSPILCKLGCQLMRFMPNRYSLDDSSGIQFFTTFFHIPRPYLFCSSHILNTHDTKSLILSGSILFARCCFPRLPLHDYIK